MKDNYRNSLFIGLRGLLSLSLLIVFGIVHKNVVKPVLSTIHAEWFWTIYNAVDFLAIPLLAFGCMVPVAAGIVMETGRRFWGVMSTVEIGGISLIYVFVTWVIGGKALYLAAWSYQNLPTIYVLIFVPFAIVHLMAALVLRLKFIGD